jgi:hypothetical protein
MYVEHGQCLNRRCSTQGAPFIGTTSFRGEFRIAKSELVIY